MTRNPTPNLRAERLEFSKDAIDVGRDPYQGPDLGPQTERVATRIAQGFMHTTNPDGVDVVFVPGEALPDWVPTDVEQTPA